MLALFILPPSRSATASKATTTKAASKAAPSTKATATAKTTPATAKASTAQAAQDNNIQQRPRATTATTAAAIVAVSAQYDDNDDKYDDDGQKPRKTRIAPATCLWHAIIVARKHLGKCRAALVKASIIITVLELGYHDAVYDLF